MRLAALIAAFLAGAAGLRIAQGDVGLDLLLLQTLAMAVGQLPSALVWAELPLLLEIARLACPLALIWAGAGLFQMVFGNRLSLGRIRARGEHMVVADTGSFARTLVEGELARAKPVVIVGRRSDAPWIVSALQNGAVLSPDLAQCGLETARILAITGTDSRSNMAKAREALAGADRIRATGNPLEIVATINDSSVADDAYDRTMVTPGGRVRMALLPDIIARQMFRDQSIDAFCWTDKPESTVVVIGFSVITRLYIVRQLMAGSARGRRKIRVVVIDHDVDAARAELHHYHGTVDALSPVVYVQWDRSSSSLALLIANVRQEHGPPVVYVIDDGQDLRQRELAETVLAVHRSADLPLPPVLARFENLAREDLPPGVKAFGNDVALEDAEALTQERLDEIARALHEFYVEGRLSDGEQIGSRESLREWEDLPERYRADNRMVADCHRLKLREIGVRIVDRKASQTSGFRLGFNEHEELARAEHERWMVAKLADGWQHGPIRDDSNKQHPNMVPYADLSESVRDLDREQVQVLTQIVARQGGTLMRVLDVALLAPAETSLALESLVEALSRHYPDRLPRFSVLGDRPEMVERLCARDVPVRLIVSSFGITPPGVDAVAAVPKGQELQTLCEDTEICVTWDSGPTTLAKPLIRLDRVGKIIGAPWL